MTAAALKIHDPSSALRTHYFLRAGVAAAWVAAAFTVGVAHPVIGSALLIAYPAWDALANFLDARANGGFRANPSQAVNTAVSLAAAIAMAWASTVGAAAMIGVFGVWAVLAGLFQLVTGVRRWRTHGAQWLMVLSGAQSILAGGFFVALSARPAELSIASVAGYAAFGAVYFLASALWLAFRKPRKA